ncbi:MAG TPA: hypothetical protein VJ723_09500 [Candidatus Angelobacter sp.]|nr:hypothetical protein [Candidatus Angelobacter sp.]
MSEKQRDMSKPHPREAFGRRITDVDRNLVSDHKPGHDESAPPTPAAKARGAHLAPAVLPAHNSTKVPKTSISTRVQERLARKE